MGEHAPWPEGTISSFSVAEQGAAVPLVGSDIPDHVKRTMSRYPSPVAAMTSFSAVVCLAGGIYLGVTEGQWWFVPMAFVLGLLAFLIYSRDRRWLPGPSMKARLPRPCWLVRSRGDAGGDSVQTTTRRRRWTRKPIADQRGVHRDQSSRRCNPVARCSGLLAHGR